MKALLTGSCVLSLYFVLEGNSRYWTFVGLVPLMTALVGYCPLYILPGFNTCPANPPCRLRVESIIGRDYALPGVAWRLFPPATAARTVPASSTSTRSALAMVSGR